MALHHHTPKQRKKIRKQRAKVTVKRAKKK